VLPRLGKPWKAEEVEVEAAAEERVYGATPEENRRPPLSVGNGAEDDL